MTAFFIIVLLVPLAVACLAYFLSDEISLLELIVLVAVQVIVAGTATYIVSRINTDDVETWSGYVVEKHREIVPCAHSYPCNCHTTCTGGKNQTCSTTCQTCYLHLRDYDWVVVTSNAEVVTIARVDLQGAAEPPRFTSTRIGDVTAVGHTYTNYVKAAPGTLFKHQGSSTAYAAELPDYPTTYDYYRIDRHLIGGTPPRAGPWSRALDELNSDIGARKEANVIVVTVVDRPIDWYYALEEKWVGGKQNDVILVVSTDADHRPQWAQVMTWSKNEMLKVGLRDAVMDMPTLDRDRVIDALRDHVSSKFERRSMEDFKYLSSTITPTFKQWVLTLLAALSCTIGLVFVFYRYDPFSRLVSQKHHFRRR